MKAEEFRRFVNALASTSGERVVNFSEEDGKHTAKMSGGEEIISNGTALSVGIKWGSGHYARIPSQRVKEILAQREAVPCV